MKTLELKGQLRETTGSKGAAMLRREEMIPCVLYGGKENIHFAATEADLKSFIYTPNVYIAEINLGDKTFRGVMKDLQSHPVTDKVTHIDFLEVSDDKKIRVHLPVTVIGNSVGVREGGKLVVNVRKLMVEALPADMPDDIKVDISNLKIGDALRIRELSAEKVQFLEAENVVVAAVRVTRNTKSAQAAEEAKK